MSADKDLISVQQARDLVEARTGRRRKSPSLTRRRSIESAKRWPRRRCAKQPGSARWRSKKPATAFPTTSGKRIVLPPKTFGTISRIAHSRRRFRIERCCRDRQPARRRRRHHSFHQSNFNRDFQSPDRDQIPKRDRAVAASVGRSLYQRNCASDARGRRQRRFARGRDRLHDDGDDRRH